MKILLKNANVLLVETSDIKKLDILIKDDQIDKIEENIVCRDAQIIDCHGKWIMPGLIDMHVHIKESFAPLFTASGVTTVRNTSGCIFELEDMIKANANAVTPRVITSDRLIDGPPGLWGPTSPYSINIDDEKSARDEVRRQVALGAELIKVYALLDRKIMAAVCDEASKHNKEVSADLVHSTHVHALEAGELGVTWLEHASGILQLISPEWSMKADTEIWDKMNWQEFDDNAIRNLCYKLLDHKVKLCPTITLYDQGYLADKPWKPHHPIIEKLEENKGMMKQWHYIMQSGSIKTKVGVQHNFIKKVSKIYHDIGGVVVCGTDTPAGVNVYPGMALHREMELFVESGFTEYEAIRAATIISADSINQPRLGRIEEGALADLIILNSDPVLNISNTKDIESIIKGGKVYSPSQLIGAVPNDEVNQKNFEVLLVKLKENGFNVDMFQ